MKIFLTLSKKINPIRKINENSCVNKLNMGEIKDIISINSNKIE